MPLRFSLVCAVLAAAGSLVCPEVARAQGGADDAWKSMVMQGLYHAGANEYPQAEQTLLAAVRQAERFGADDPRVGTTLNSLGLVYRAEKKFADSEKAYTRALGILEKTYGVESIDAANVNFNIATVMFDEGHQALAVPFIRKALSTYEKLLGGTSVKTASVLCMLGDSFLAVKNFADAEGPLRRCADIREADGGMQNPDLAEALHSLSLVYAGLGQYSLAEPRMKLAEKIRENTLGLTNPLVAQTMEDHATMLKQMGHDKESERLATLAAAIRRSQGASAANKAPGKPAGKPAAK